ncbi:MotA/TolQ/ExbB proton channel family protein [Undibacterium oligocarboniphilum]|uniref:Biopolymer transport protein ExbB n=1 Tax=Undibacterium oligocarboniphilum TaxID=666702 RepID=A0A850QAY9_9BURK|nr:MotA/TolQ/ExbB proton channel family protein [Undibacterium oligocarboniphilum]MBC3869896.1 MotA/TolQ/ExbB proton channel family protein [Undibacterium oligocarboniphilum]NVO77512.1 MotA/TolQ/ExbB proton channel family protein [Undibacterium oligocarboniphilum]
MHSAIAQYWEQADQFGHTIAYLLFGMSLLSWTLILAKTWSFWRVRQAASFLQQFWLAPTLDDALSLLRLHDREQIFLSLADGAAEAARAERGATLSAASDLREVLTRHLRQRLQKLTRKLENGLTVLASIGATAPFVGLLGTVWGIYHALTSISAAGMVQIDQLAGPVGEALIMTAFGLIVAIPSVLAYNALQRVHRITMAELDGFAHDLLLHFCPPSASREIT